MNQTLIAAIIYDGIGGICELAVDLIHEINISADAADKRISGDLRRIFDTRTIRQMQEILDLIENRKLCPDRSRSLTRSDTVRLTDRKTADATDARVAIALLYGILTRRCCRIRRIDLINITLQLSGCPDVRQ